MCAELCEGRQAGSRLASRAEEAGPRAREEHDEDQTEDDQLRITETPGLTAHENTQLENDASDASKRRLHSDVVGARRSWERKALAEGTPFGVVPEMTLPDLYLAYTSHTGEELRDALLRVANEPRENPNRRTVLELLTQHLSSVVEIFEGPSGRFGERRFFVAATKAEPKKRKLNDVSSGLTDPSCIRKENDGCASETRKLWSPRPRKPFARASGEANGDGARRRIAEKTRCLDGRLDGHLDGRLDAAGRLHHLAMRI
jgi:hypothetical protein